MGNGYTLNYRKIKLLQKLFFAALQYVEIYINLLRKTFIVVFYSTLHIRPDHLNDFD